MFKDGKSKVDAIANRRPWTKKNMCPYCMREVAHFLRHLKRNHAEEGAVREFAGSSKPSKKRKILLDSIRRQGNYVRHKSEAVIRPIRRLRDTEPNRDLSNGSYIPCDYCLGFFERNYIRRNRKQCSLNHGAVYSLLRTIQGFLRLSSIEKRHFPYNEERWCFATSHG